MSLMLASSRGFRAFKSPLSKPGFAHRTLLLIFDLHLARKSTTCGPQVYIRHCAPSRSRLPRSTLEQQILQHHVHYRFRSSSTHPSDLPWTALETDSLSPKSIPSEDVYHPPTRGFLFLIPRAWVPYAELMRLEKPTGLYLFYLPYLFGLLFAASTAHPTIMPLPLLTASIQFFSGTIILRGAACTWNDTHDRAYDRLVARTRLRPVARGAIYPFQAHVFTAAQSIVGLLLLYSMPLQVSYYSLPVIAILGLYPFAKRVTHYPQVILGVPVAWGVFLGSAALGCDPVALWLGQGSQSGVGGALGCFYMANIAWTVIYDTIYAHQDVKDDAKAGVKSMAVRHLYNTKTLLSWLAVVQTSLLLATGMLAEMGSAYFVGSCGAGVSLATMIWRVDLKRPSECMWWFKHGTWFVGGSITLGLVGEYFTMLRSDSNEAGQDVENL